jgi:hypothetical protein
MVADPKGEDAMPDEINPTNQPMFISAYVEDVPAIGEVNARAIRCLHIVM